MAMLSFGVLLLSLPWMFRLRFAPILEFFGMVYASLAMLLLWGSGWSTMVLVAMCSPSPWTRYALSISVVAAALGSTYPNQSWGQFAFHLAALAIGASAFWADRVPR